MNHLYNANEGFYQRLSQYVKSKIQNPHDAEEITQDILLKLLQNSKLEKVENFSAWTYRVAKNTIIDFYRRKKIEINNLMENMDIQEQNEDGHNEIAQCLVPLIYLLPEEDQAILNAVEIKGITQKAYAAQQGLPYSTAKSKIQRARKKLKEEIENCCHLEFDRLGMPTRCKNKEECQ